MRIPLLVAAAASAWVAACPAQDRLAARAFAERQAARAPLPPHAALFEFALPHPGPRRSVEEFAADLPDPAAVAGLLRFSPAALNDAGLPTDRLEDGLRGPDRDAADACGLLLGLAGGPAAEKTLADAVLDRGRRGEDPTGCALGLLVCGGEKAARWLTAVCVRPNCPAGFSLGVLRACDAGVRQPSLGVSRGTAAALAAALLDARPVADGAADYLADWRAWERSRDVLAAAAAEDDPDAVRGRAFRIACVRFALACAEDPAAGPDGALCRRWLADVRAADPDLFRRADLTRR